MKNKHNFVKLLFVRNIFLLTTVIFSLGSTKAQFRISYNDYILFGEEAAKNKANEVFFDRLGDLYPSVKVDNQKMRDEGAALHLYFNGNSEFKKQMQTEYQRSTGFFEFIQDSIVARKARLINSTIEDTDIKSITFILVGYNNSYAEANVSLGQLEAKIKAIEPKTFVIKLFWDGTSLKLPLDNFRYATATSYFVGLGMRQLISGLKCKNIVMISHSLGANVICQTLFNQSSKVTNFTGVLDYLEGEYERGKFKTPQLDKHITAAIVGPAMPGTNTFADYMDRSYKSDGSKKDSYSLMIGYNTNDNVLKKYIGIRGKLGSTTLGSSKEEVDAVEKQFKDNYKNSPIKIYDFSPSGSEHSILSYMKYKVYDQMLKDIYITK